MESLQSHLGDFLRTIGPNEEISLVFLQQLWPQVVGKELAANSRPRSLNKKKLLISVCSDVWKQELQGLRGVLTGTINKYWGFRLVETIDLEVRRTSRAET